MGDGVALDLHPSFHAHERVQYRIAEEKNQYRDDRYHDPDKIVHHPSFGMTISSYRRRDQARFLKSCCDNRCKRDIEAIQSIPCALKSQLLDQCIGDMIAALGPREKANTL